MSEINTPMTPKEIVHALGQHIVGQEEAKRAVSIALRNRWRRQQLDGEMKKEVMPKNILMIGPTGVGKTEIARRLSTLADAPFIKIEATKFTEVGYVGRDVDSIIRDLIESAIKQMREREKEKNMPSAEIAAEEKILDALIPSPTTEPATGARGGFTGEPAGETNVISVKKEESATRQLFRQKLRDGKLDEKEIEVEIAAGGASMEIMGPPGMEDMMGQLQGMMDSLSRKRTKKVRLNVKTALRQLRDDEAAKLVNEDEIKTRAIEAVEQNGIVFLDEIDKIVRTGHASGGADVSREGVQRDLLPLIEGSTVFTKYGMIKTDHILFIASGAFHLAKPSDLIPELQGRLPIRVELRALSIDDFVRILTEPTASLIKQYKALLGTEGIDLTFTDDAIRRLAEIAYKINDTTENIGARRLHTIMERLLEIISFDAPDRSGEKIKIDKEYVNSQLEKLLEDEDLSHYIL